jgi:thioredoxin 2
MALTSDDRGVLVRCSSCGKTNRLPYPHLNRTIRCGHCHADLPSPSSPIDAASAAAFDALVAQSPLPIVVDFWAPWCGPCRMMAPEVEKVAQRTAGQALVVKVDTEAVPDLGARFGIQSIPTVAVFRGGREVARESGARPAADIQALLARS